MAKEHPGFPRNKKFRFEWERIVRRCRMSIQHKAVAFVLAQYGDSHGLNIRPGVPRLSAACNIGQSTTRRYVEYLLNLGLIERLSHGGGPERRAAVYRLAIPEDIAERIEMFGPDETTPMGNCLNSAHVESAVVADYSASESERSDDGYSAHPDPLLRSDGSSTPLAQESAHQGTHQGDQHQGDRSPEVSTSPSRPDRNEDPSDLWRWGGASGDRPRGHVCINGWLPDADGQKSATPCPTCKPHIRPKF